MPPTTTAPQRRRSSSSSSSMTTRTVITIIMFTTIVTVEAFTSSPPLSQTKKNAAAFLSLRRQQQRGNKELFFPSSSSSLWSSTVAAVSSSLLLLDDPSRTASTPAKKKRQIYEMIMAPNNNSDDIIDDEVTNDNNYNDKILERYDLFSSIPTSPNSFSSSSVYYYGDDEIMMLMNQNNNSNKALSSEASSLSLLQRYPFVCGTIITTIKVIIADLVAQFIVLNNNGSLLLTLDGSGSSIFGLWDMKRTIAFGLFGFFYQGMAQYMIVNKGLERLFPGNSIKNVVSKIFGMNFVSDPFLFYPVFYIFKESVAVLLGGGSSGGDVAAAASLSFAAAEGGTAVVGGSMKLVHEILGSALDAYTTNFVNDVRTSWMVWLPGHTVTYGFMPQHKRIPWMAFVGFFYMCVLSVTRG